MTNTPTPPADLTGRRVDRVSIGGHTQRTGRVLTDDGGRHVLVDWEDTPDHSRVQWVARAALRTR